ncbi:MAG TPA: hypothetical protein PKJ47_08705 [Candidatus Limiplasma sp.]|nr:hypothetical protein [Candidatus Limiplasma sp.]
MSNPWRAFPYAESTPFLDILWRGVDWPADSARATEGLRAGGIHKRYGLRETEISIGQTIIK